MTNATYQCFYPGCGNFEVRAANIYLAAFGAIQFVKSKLGADHAVDGWKLTVVQEPQGQA